MSGFSDCFNHLLKSRELTCIEAAKICKMDLSTIFRWSNGEFLPENWERLNPIRKKLRLTPWECNALEEVFRKGKMGEEQSQCFEEIVSMFRILGKVRDTYQSNQGSQGNQNTQGNQSAQGIQSCGQQPGNVAVCSMMQENGKDAAGFIKLDSQVMVWQALQSVLEAESRQEGVRLYLKLHTIPDLLLIQLKQFCSLSASSQVEVILCVGCGEKERKLTKLKLLRSMIDLMVQRNQVHLFWGNALHETGVAEQSWMLSGHFFLQFSEDMSHGILTGNAEWIAFFQDSVERMEQASLPICRKNVDTMEYIGKRKVEPFHIMAIEYMPCISFGLTEEILQDIIYQEIPFREDLIQGIIYNFPRGISKIGSLHSYFTKRGLEEFMETGRVEIFPYNIYRGADPKQRYEILSNLIRQMRENGNVHSLLLREGFLDLKGIHIEQKQWQQEALCIELHYEKDRKEEIEILDKDIQEEFRMFCNCLQQVGYLYCEEETLAYMEDLLWRYHNVG